MRIFKSKQERQDIIREAWLDQLERDVYFEKDGHFTVKRAVDVPARVAAVAVQVLRRK